MANQKVNQMTSKLHSGLFLEKCSSVKIKKKLRQYKNKRHIRFTQRCNSPRLSVSRPSSGGDAGASATISGGDRGISSSSDVDAGFGLQWRVELRRTVPHGTQLAEYEQSCTDGGLRGLPTVPILVGQKAEETPGHCFHPKNNSFDGGQLFRWSRSGQPPCQRRV